LFFLPYSTPNKEKQNKTTTRMETAYSRPGDQHDRAMAGGLMGDWVTVDGACIFIPDEISSDPSITRTGDTHSGAGLPEDIDAIPGRETPLQEEVQTIQAQMALLGQQKDALRARLVDSEYTAAASVGSVMQTPGPRAARQGTEYPLD
jgi:hypothetical protein